MLTFGRVSAQSVLDNFYLSFSSSLFLDIVQTPITYTSTYTGTMQGYVDVPSQSFQLSQYSFGFEPRYNIQQLNDDAAIAVAVPFSFGIGYAVAANDNVRGVQQSFGSLQVPVLAKFYYGNSSTYVTEKDFGISFGGGLEYNKIGLIGGDPDDKEDGLHKGFILPVMTLGVHFWRGSTPFEVNMKYGQTKVEEYRIDRNGNQLTDEAGNPITRTGKGSSFKLTFLYLLNY